jgi:hypothetical protein
MQGFRNIGYHWKEVIVTDFGHLSANNNMHFNEIK